MSIGRVGIVMLLVWMLAVAGGALIIALTVPGDRQYIAVKQLKLNHRLVEGDVAEAGVYQRFLVPDVSTRADFHGRYVARVVEPFETLRLAATSSGPQLSPWRPGHSIVWVSLRDLPVAEASTLDVQDVLHACILGKSTCGAVTVLAIACNGADTSTCSAAIDLTPAQGRHYLDALLKAGKNATSAGPPIGVVTERFGGQR